MKTIVVAVLLSLLGPNPVAAQSEEFLYATTPKTGIPDLLVIDPATGLPVTSQVFDVPGAVGSSGLTYEGRSLLTIGRGPIWDDLLRVHPVGARSVNLGTTDEQWASPSLELHPHTGKLFAVGVPSGINALHLYELDRQTGSPTFIGVVTENSITCFAIHPHTGVAYGTDTTGPRIFTIDLTDGHTTQVGLLPLFSGRFFDLAFNSQGELWGSFYDVGSPGTDTGLYKIDYTNSTYTKVVSVPLAYNGLAFAPACFGEVYCTAKTNSLGCVPEISAWGQGSPTTNRGLELTATNLRNNRVGLLLYGTSGAAAIPFLGGTLCVRPSFEYAVPIDSAGHAPPIIDCSGAWFLDFNTYLSERYPLRSATPAPPPILRPGTVVHAQWLGRDSSGRVSLTDAVRFEMCQ